MSNIPGITLFLSIIIVLASICIGFFILVLLGNLTAMKFLAKNGLAVFSQNIKKDYKLLNYVNKEGACWLSIPNICYSPVMYNCNGKYKNHNFLQKENRYGELFLADGSKYDKLKAMGYGDTEHIIQDLSVIRGMPFGNGNDLRHANFSQLRKVTEGIREDGGVEIEVCENNIIRKFKVISLLDLDIGNLHSFKYENRNDFLESILNMSKIKLVDRVPTENVLLLECKTDIDIVIVMLIEKN